MSAQADKIAGVSIELQDLLEVRARLAGLSFTGIRRRPGFRSGARHARVRGRGMEYEESRAYVAGDDMRTMDWRVMARTGEAHTKIFAEERERRFLLAVDLSASMYFGTRLAFKSWAAAQVAAHVGWLASFAGDRIGGLVVTPDAHYEVRPGKTRSALLGVFHHLVEASGLQPDPAAARGRLDFLLRELYRVIKPGSVVALISDLIGLDPEARDILGALAGHNDINIFWIHDRSEVESWPAGRYPVRIGQRRVELELGGDDGWLRQLQLQHRAEIEALAALHALPLLPVCCNREITPQILQALGPA